MLHVACQDFRTAKVCTYVLENGSNNHYNIVPHRQQPGRILDEKALTKEKDIGWENFHILRFSRVVRY